MAGRRAWRVRTIPASRVLAGKSTRRHEQTQEGASLGAMDWGSVPAWVTAGVSTLFGFLSWRSSRKSKNAQAEADPCASDVARVVARCERRDDIVSMWLKDQGGFTFSLWLASPADGCHRRRR